MPRYSLRTLLILLAVGPPILAGVGWFLYEGMVLDLRGGGVVFSHRVDGIWVEDKWQVNDDWSVSFSRKK